MVALKNACFCFTLRTGNLILGWLQLIFGTIAVAIFAAMIPMIDQMQDKDLPENVTRHDMKVAVIILLILSVIAPVIGICHLYGSYKYRKGFLMPYLIGGGIQLGLMVIGVIFCICKLRASDVISQIISLLIAIYFYLIPWSFYKELRDGRTPGMQHA